MTLFDSRLKLLYKMLNVYDCYFWQNNSKFTFKILQHKRKNKNHFKIIINVFVTLFIYKIYYYPAS